MKIAVIGTGHLGKIHTRIYSEMGDVQLTAVVDVRENEAKALAEKYHTQAITDYHTLLGQVDAISIATPTVTHYEIAKAFLNAGTHVLIEKPFTTLASQAEELVELAEAKHCKIQVGHSERCNPVIVAFNTIGFAPLFIETQRWSPYRFRSGDIGVVLDLMVHDVDLVQSWIKSPVKDIRAIGVNLFGPKEDVAHAYITYQSGEVACLTTSRAAQSASRKIKMFSRSGYAELDLGAGQGKIYRIRPEYNPIELNLQKGIPSQFSGMTFEQIFYEKILTIEELVIPKIEPLGIELSSFVQCIRNDSKPLVEGKEALSTMVICEKILQQMAKM